MKELRDEVCQEIKALTPNRIISSKHRNFQDFDYNLSDKDITEMTGVPRLFHVGAATTVGPDTIGHTLNSTVEDIPITFVYPRKTRWEIAANDDLKEVRNFFMKNVSAVTGVNQRVIKYQTPEIEDHSSDPWRYYTIHMTAWIEADHT